MKLRKQSHCVYQCEYHLVFATKYRRKIFNEGIFVSMLERLKEVGEHYPEIDILEINHDQDHIHMLVSIPPKMSVSKVVGILKVNTSRRLKEKFSFLVVGILKANTSRRLKEKFSFLVVGILKANTSRRLK